jgi:hypothetical protein
MNIIISAYLNKHGERFLASQKNIRLKDTKGIKAAGVPHGVAFNGPVKVA